LPKRLASDLSGAFENGGKAIAMLDDITTTEAAVNAAAGEYRPLQRVVRDLQKDMRKLDAEMERLRKAGQFLNSEEDAERIASIEVRRSALQAEKEDIAAQIPESWEEVHTTFANLTKAEETARNTYRRTADASVEPVAEFLAVLDANAEFAALKPELDKLGDLIATAEPEQAEAAVDEVAKLFNAVAGARDVASPLSKAKRSLRGNRLDREQATEDYAEAVDAYEEQIAWRGVAADNLRVGVQAYMDAVAETIGARQNSNLSRTQALFLANCNAVHRDLSLNF
jgi:DNA repair exonuclease SbcCD ATPase subunit